MPASATACIQTRYGTPPAPMRDVDFAGQHRHVNSPATTASARAFAEDHTSSSNEHTAKQSKHGSATRCAGSDSAARCASDSRGPRRGQDRSSSRSQFGSQAGRKRQTGRREEEAGDGASATVAASTTADPGADAAAASAGKIRGWHADGGGAKLDTGRCVVGDTATDWREPGDTARRSI